MGNLIKDRKIYNKTPQSFKTINGNSIIGSGDLSIGGALASNIIYVDSTYGNNSTGAINNPNKPYLEPEYIFSNLTNSGTVTCTTTTGSATLTSVSSTTNIVKGQIFYGTGIASESYVVSFTSNTIVLSKPCTANGTVTGTWVTQYLLVLSGNFTQSGNWSKDGYSFVGYGATVNYSTTLFDFTSPRYSPLIIDGVTFIGTAVGARLIYNSTNGATYNSLTIMNCSLGTASTTTTMALGNGATFTSIDLVNNNFNCYAGTISNITSTSRTNIIGGYYYGLLGGLSTSRLNFDATVETPTNINALVTAQGAGGTASDNIKGRIIGSVSLGLYSTTTFNATMVGTTFACAADNFSGEGTIVCTTGSITNNRGDYSFSGSVVGAFSCIGFTNFSAFSGTFTATGGSHIVNGINNYNNSQYSITSINLSGSSTLRLGGIAGTKADNASYYGCTITIASGSTLFVNGYLGCQISSLAGRMVVTGTGEMYHQYLSTAITGRLENLGGKIVLVRPSAENASNTPSLSFSTGTYIQDGGSLVCDVADSKSGLIRKTASGGKVILKGQPYLKVANGLAPLQILSNTGTAQDIFDFNLIDNCAVGFRIADTFSDVTYGTAYAPNLLIGGTKYEATTNTW